MKARKKTVRKFKPTHIYAIISTALVLFMLGVLSLIFLQGKKLTNQFKENLEFSVIFKDNAEESQILDYKKQLETEKFVHSTTYISKDEAAKKFVQETGEDFTEILDYNPLYASVNIRLKSQYANPDSLNVIQKKVISNPLVSEFYYEKRLVEVINRNVRKAGFVVLAISLLLIIVTITLIDSTVRLGMYSHRFLIRSMQLVGATRGFITKPFLVRSLLDGFFSGLLAVGILLSLLNLLIKFIPELRILQDVQLTLMLFSGIILMGVLFSLVSTYFAVKKYLQIKLDDLY